MQRGSSAIAVDNNAIAENWYVFGKTVPKQEAVFFSQIILLYIVAITCILNLSLTTENSTLWTALLSSSLGYILPSPSIKKTKYHKQPQYLESSSSASPSHSMSHATP